MNIESLCPVCLDEYESPSRLPQLLPCLHTTCESCVSDILREAQEKDYSACCQTCQEPFTFENVTNLDAFGVSSICKSHPSNKMSLFCKPCEVTICTECLHHAHKEHAHQSLEDAEQQLKANLRGHMTDLTIRVSELGVAQNDLYVLHGNLVLRSALLTKEIGTTFQQLIDDLKDRLRASQRQASNWLQWWTRAAGEHRVVVQQERIHAFEERRDSLIASARTQLKADMKAIEMQQHELESSIKFIAAARAQTEPLLVNTSLPAIQLVRLLVTVSTGLKHLLEPHSFEPVVKDTLRFCFLLPADIMNADMSLFGAVMRPRDYCSIGQPSMVFNTEGRLLVSQIGIAQLANGDVVIADGNSCLLKVFTLDGTFVRDIPITAPPYDIATNPATNDIWVAGSRSLLCFSSEGVLLRQIATKTPSVGIAVCYDGAVIATCGNNKRVQAFNADGKQRWSLTKGFSNPRGVTVVPNGDVIVCDTGNHRLQVLSAVDGHFIRTICAGQIECPQGVAAIPHSNKIVLTEQFRISIWTLSGEFVHQWCSSGTQPGQVFHAWGVTVLADERIAVVDFGNYRIQIF